MGVRVASEEVEREAGALHGDDQRRDAEEGAIDRVALLAVQVALAEGAAGCDQHRDVRTEQEQRREIDGVRNGHRRSARRQREVDLERGRHRGEHQQCDEEHRLIEGRHRQTDREQRYADRDDGGDIMVGSPRQLVHQWTRGAVETQFSPQSSFSTDQST